MTTPSQKISHPDPIVFEAGDTSPPINCAGRMPTGVYLPAGFAGTSITFEVSEDGVAFVEFQVAGAAYSVTVAANTFALIDHTKFFGINRMRLKTETAQSAGTELILMMGADV